MVDHKQTVSAQQVIAVVQLPVMCINWVPTVEHG